MAFSGGVINEYCIGKDLEGSVCGQIVIARWNCVVDPGECNKHLSQDS
jgi:hypothetical protein